MANMNKGDSVMVIAGVKDVDIGTDLSGWRGRVASVYRDGTVAVEWDSLTLAAMGMDAIRQADEAGLDWMQYVLNQSEVTLVPAADTEADVKAAIKRIAAQLK